MKKSSTWTLYVDGAARNNPGPAGAGIYIEKNGIVDTKQGYYLGIKTNNQAEYLALLFGLLIINDHIVPGDSVEIVSDSQLMVRQLTGVYKIKQVHLKPLYTLCQYYIHQMNAKIKHMMRDYNKEADIMANYGIDNKILPPKHYIFVLQQHDIFL